METIVARLLRAFEQGRIDRRQLIRSLAVAAAGAYGAGSGRTAQALTRAGAEAAPASSAAPAAFETIALDHISYAVADYGRSRDFYADLMGWEVVSDNGQSQATLRIGEVGDIIIRNNRRQTSQPSGRPDRPPLTGVINHVAWRIAEFDTEAVRAELERRGLNPRRDQGGGGDYDSYHVLDPDGWDLQISR